eukprot:8811642-Pyramimonas_sp.AAC.1
MNYVMSMACPITGQARSAPETQIIERGGPQFLATGCRSRDQIRPRTEAGTIGRAPEAEPVCLKITLATYPTPAQTRGAN